MKLDNGTSGSAPQNYNLENAYVVLLIWTNSSETQITLKGMLKYYLYIYVYMQIYSILECAYT